jgi:hypothetical protein
MDLEEIGYSDMVGIDLAQDSDRLGALANKVIDFRVL